SKRGMTGISSATAADLGPYGIRCNTISPGPLQGVRLDEVIERFAASRGIASETVSEQMVHRAALRRHAGDEDVCELVLFLCSDHARNITGQDIAVDAGLRLM